MKKEIKAHTHKQNAATKEQAAELGYVTPMLCCFLLNTLLFRLCLLGP